MSLPDFNGFSNVIIFEQESLNFADDARADISVNLVSSKRIEKYMLVTSISLSEQHKNFDFTIERELGKNLRIRFTPINIINGNLTNPKISFEKGFKNVYAQGFFDF